MEIEVRFNPQGEQEIWAIEVGEVTDWRKGGVATAETAGVKYRNSTRIFHGTEEEARAFVRKIAKAVQDSEFE